MDLLFPAVRQPLFPSSKTTSQPDHPMPNSHALTKLPRITSCDGKATRLLVSVQNAAEARVAIKAQVDMVDIKDPEAGPLGRPASHIVDQIVALQQCESSPRPVSAALGEIDELVGPGDHASTTQRGDVGDDATLPANGLHLAGLSYVKVGFAGAGDAWRQQAIDLAGLLPAAGPGLILAAYADHTRAHAPSVEHIAQCVIDGPFAGLLIDTHTKDSLGLRHWMSLATLQELITTLRQAGRLIALAGSLREADLPPLLAMKPDIIALRGAACVGADRRRPLDPQRLEQLQSLFCTGHAQG